jgi:hypothetical protein
MLQAAVEDDGRSPVVRSAGERRGRAGSPLSLLRTYVGNKGYRPPCMLQAGVKDATAASFLATESSLTKQRAASGAQGAASVERPCNEQCPELTTCF